METEILSGADLESVPCALCGCEESLVVSNVERNYLPLNTVVCARCGLVFINPRPCAVWYENFYKTLYRIYYERVDTPTPEYAGGRLRLFKHASNIAFIAPHLPGAGSVLDIGSAEGTFLGLFHKEFPEWTLYGVEPNERFVEFSRSFYQLTGVGAGTFPEAVTDGQVFDLIHASHVLEHILEPNAFLKACRRYLKADGYLFVDVPNADSKRRGIRFLHVAHVYHYTSSTLSAMLRKWGFEAIATRTDMPEPHGRRRPRLRKYRPPWTVQVLAKKLEAVPTQVAIPQCDPERIALRLRTQWKMSFPRRIKRALLSFKGSRRLPVPPL